MGERRPKSRRSRAGPSSRGGAPSALPNVRADSAGMETTPAPSKSNLRVVREVRPPLPGGWQVSAQFRWRVDRGGGEWGWPVGPGGAPARRQLEARASAKFGDFGNPALAPSPAPHSAPAGGWAREGRGLRGRRGGEVQGGRQPPHPPPLSGRARKPLSGAQQGLRGQCRSSSAWAEVARTSQPPTAGSEKPPRAPPSSPVRCAAG